ncbi:Piwi-domain-containing protein [Aulographum hederae CBS 113979]|uniref:Piwi-domain-containing protein n=1 Tax=Aulographum hederae CBS 113979 TaxID=1176131 RepID=A0A6G1H347_9PEZI|nr:Piwi-domain-containing protein [Aulographum hederae CBS 113979]
MAGASKQRAKRQPIDDANSAQASGHHDAEGSAYGRPSDTSVGRVDGNSEPRPRGPQYDNSNGPNRNPNEEPEGVIVDSRRLADTLGVTGYAVVHNNKAGIAGDLPKRGPLNNQGRAIKVGLNMFQVAMLPRKKIYQYDVLIGKGDEKRGTVRAVWDSKKLKSELGPGWIFDGVRLAWALTERPNVNILIDMDEERGRPPRVGRDNNIRVTLKCTNIVHFDSLTAYLNRQADFDNSCLEAISFIDHLMREHPSRTYTMIKKSFFSRGQIRKNLGGGVEAFKGVFSSLRMVRGIDSPCLAINVDVANGTFFTASGLLDSMVQACGCRNAADLSNVFNNSKNHWKKSDLYKTLKRFRKLRIIVNHRGTDEQYTINDFLDKDVTTFRFEQKTFDESGNQTSSTMTTLQSYFRTKYQINPVPGFPIVELTKKGTVLPLECCKILQNQRYPFKLNDTQTRDMIGFAVQPPKQRWEAVQHGLDMLEWDKDPFHKNFGFKISPQRTEVTARLLPAPNILFQNAKIDANKASGGQWRIDKMKFLTPNTRPLVAWGVCVVDPRGAGDKAAAENFFKNFVQIYATSHGGNVASKEPAFVAGNSKKGGEMITEVWNSTGNKFKQKPQIIFFVVPNKNSDTYLRIKKSCEIRYGIPSQVLQSAHVMKNQAQYISNVCMKVNAKLGGSTCKASGSIMAKIGPSHMKLPTMIMGADVSHVAPGAPGQSVAAITMSINRDCTRYAAQCASNGQRVEIISTANIRNLCGKMFKMWSELVGNGQYPKRIYYIRDGVSEGQYSHVLDQEVRDMQEVMHTLNPKADTKFTVIIASKRHHIRFFPTQGDRNGNPYPGTLVETGCTHPFEFDFYLAAHAAIKGTTRPIHYHVLKNDCEMRSEELQQMIFEHSFQYARATTAVSLHPAVYYAHLASNRSKAHEDKAELSSGKKELMKKQTSASGSGSAPTDLYEILPMKGDLNIDSGMWYI